METKDIPRTFWHALSFCMVSATLGLLFIAYKSSAVSIEIADAKIVLSSAISQTKEIKSALKLENERLIVANNLMEEKLALLVGSDKGPAGGEGKCGGAKGMPRNTVSVELLKEQGFLGGPNSELRKIEIPNKWFQELDEKIQSAEQALQK